MDNNNQKEQQPGIGFAAPGVALGEYSNVAFINNSAVRTPHSLQPCDNGSRKRKGLVLAA